MKTLSLSIIASFVFISSACGGNIIWQLGKKNENSKDFWHYKPKEFGFNLNLNKDGRFNKDKRIFTYRVKEKGVVETPRMPSGISSSSCNKFSPTIANCLVVEWESANKENVVLKVYLSRFPAKLNSENKRMRVSLPNGNVAYKKIKNGEIAIPLETQKGLNKISFDLLPSRKYNYLHFDCIQLEKTNNKAFPLAPIIEFKCEQFGNFFPSSLSEKSFEISFLNLPSNNELCLNWDISDFFGKTIKSGRISSLEKRHKFNIEGCANGYYELNLQLLDKVSKSVKLDSGKEKLTISFCIADEAPVCKKYNSAFGGHFPRHLGYQAILHDIDIDLKLIKLARASGAKWNRVFISWYGLCPERGKYKWDYYDRIFEESAKQGICSLGVIFPFTPDWACESAEMKAGRYGMPLKRWAKPNLKDYYEYVYTLVKRYKNKIYYWEVCNEPSSWPMSCYFYGSSQDYFDMLKTAWKAAKAANPECKILLGGLVLKQVQNFFPEILRLGAAKYFDILSVHYTTPSQIEIFKLMMRNSGASKPIIDSENSTPVQRKLLHEEKEIALLDARRLAIDTVKMYVSLLGANVQKIFHFTFMDLLNPDYSVSPSFAAYRTMTEMLENKVCKGKRILGVSSEMYSFVDKETNEAIIVLWNSKGISENVELPLGNATGEPALIDVSGAMRRLTPENGKINFAVSDAPVYIKGLPTAAMSFFTESSVTPRILLASSGDNSVEFEVKVKNTFNEPIKGSWTVTAPTGWETNFRKANIALSSHEEFRQKIEFRLPANLPTGVSHIDVKFSTEHDKLNFHERLLVYSLSVPSGKNLLDNCGFEQSSKNQPILWKSSGTKQVPCLSVKDNFQGSKSLLFEHKEQDNLQWSIYERAIDVLPGGIYVFKFHAKGDPGSGIHLRVIDLRVPSS